MKNFITLLLLSVSSALADTNFYVDNGRTSNGSGTAASPWKSKGNINWTTVSSALASQNVNIYFSSRATETGGLTIPGNTNGSSTRKLSLIGNEFYNTVTSGTASWQAETNPANRNAMVSTSDGIDIEENVSYLKIKGFSVTSFYGAIQVWDNAGGGVQSNVHHIEVMDNVCTANTGAENTGISFIWIEDGCHDITISGNTVQGFPAEGIYVGHYSWLTDSITGVIVENNTVINCGNGGEGDIDIKPPCYGAIVRYNTHYNTNPPAIDGSTGIVVHSNNTQVYGNTLYNQSIKGDGDWGYGIMLTADGDGVGNGKAVTSALIYNNVIYGNEGPAGIRIMGTAAAVSGVKLWNNTIASNVQSGIELRNSVTVAEMYNNIISSNAAPQLISESTSQTITAANYNLWYSSTTPLITYRGTNRTWAQWQALGFDANGVNANPLFTNAAAGDYTLQSGSPAKGAGTNLSGNFAVDITGATRIVPWDIGAYETASGSTGTIDCNTLNVTTLRIGP